MNTIGDRGIRANDDDVRDAIKVFFAQHGHCLPIVRSGLVLLEGSASSEVYWIESGHIQVTRFAANGRHSILREMGPGEIFGEMAAIDGQPRSASVSVVGGECSLRQVSAEQFHQLMLEQPQVALWLARGLADRIRDLTQRTVELATMSVGSRLQSHILKLCERNGVNDDLAVIKPLPTHSELAAMIGTNREAVTRELRSLAREKIVLQNKRQLTVMSVSNLSKLLAKTTGALN